MTRVVSVLDLVDDAALIAEYRARHAPGAVWPDIIRYLTSIGCENLELWQVADRLVMIFEAAEGYPRATDPALDPVVAAWEAEMSVYQRAIDPAGPKWLPMERIFTYDGGEAMPGRAEG